MVAQVVVAHLVQTQRAQAALADKVLQVVMVLNQPLQQAAEAVVQALLEQMVTERQRRVTAAQA